MRELLVAKWRLVVILLRWPGWLDLVLRKGFGTMWISGTSDGFCLGSDPKLATEPWPLAVESAQLGSTGEEDKETEAAEELDTHEFGRMVLLVRSNDRLFDELRSNQARIAEAMAYLGRSDSNQALGWIRLERLRERHLAILERLRFNRIKGRQLLARLEAPTRIEPNSLAPC